MLAITQGDPAGIGPEIIASAWPKIYQYEPVVLGHPATLEKAVKLSKNSAKVKKIDSIDELKNHGFDFEANTIPCIKVVDDESADAEYGKISGVAGKAAFDAISAAIDLAKSGKVAGIVTAPINKESLHLAGFNYPGHTEILAEKCGCSDFGMMLYLGPGDYLGGKDGLAVVHVTLHTAMRNIFEQITIESVSQKIALIRDFMKKVKNACEETGAKNGAITDEKIEPKIGVCSLNPHAGENGLFGTEELKIIAPAVEAAKKNGVNVEGPFPADTIMVQAKQGRFDAVVAMFHDQGHIALKLLGMFSAVNITLGLPIIRTSVAHGTAFEIAGKGIADPGSMIEAVRVAQRLASDA
ncbi:MAG: 4-hydroxythreonine-4-phosphate dehydrogenase PdxA [Thermoguttaceae bacterium]